MDSGSTERRREGEHIPPFGRHHSDAMKNNRSKPARKTSRKDFKTWPSPMERIQTRTAPLQYVAQISLSILLLYQPAMPTPLVEPRLASTFARGTYLPRLTCFLSQIHPEAIQAVFSDDPARQLEATIKLRKLLSKKDNPPIDRIIACGVVPRFAEFLAGPRAALQVRRFSLICSLDATQRMAWPQRLETESVPQLNTARTMITKY